MNTEMTNTETVSVSVHLDTEVRVVPVQFSYLDGNDWYVYMGKDLLGMIGMYNGHWGVFGEHGKYKYTTRNGAVRALVQSRVKLVRK